MCLALGLIQIQVFFGLALCTPSPMASRSQPQGMFGPGPNFEIYFQVEMQSYLKAFCNFVHTKTNHLKHAGDAVGTELS
jgi:hypothetical protein